MTRLNLCQSAHVFVGKHDCFGEKPWHSKTLWTKSERSL